MSTVCSTDKFCLIYTHFFRIYEDKVFQFLMTPLIKKIIRSIELLTNDGSIID